MAHKMEKEIEEEVAQVGETDSTDLEKKSFQEEFVDHGLRVLQVVESARKVPRGEGPKMACKMEKENEEEVAQVGEMDSADLERHRRCQELDRGR